MLTNMRRILQQRDAQVALTTVAIVLAAAVAARGEPRPIDTERSTLTVFVYKSGMFSAFADDHIIRAPIASGSISDEAPLAVSIAVKSASLKVLDPKLSADKRSEVQTRMLGPEVLDTAAHPDITFKSTEIAPAGESRWTVNGELSIHGKTQAARFSVERREGRYRGTVTLKQRDFGIQPISIAGGTVKVKDELKVEFDIVASR
jgi:polyisoprenoid-binding protein YceI